MLLKVIDGEGQEQTIIVEGQETVVDQSGTITADQTSQNVVAENDSRSGFFFYNPLNNDNMWVNDLGAAVADDSKSFLVMPGGRWPPQGYPISVGAIQVIGTIGQAYLAREW